MNPFTLQILRLSGLYQLMRTLSTGLLSTSKVHFGNRKHFGNTGKICMYLWKTIQFHNLTITRNSILVTYHRFNSLEEHLIKREKLLTK